MCLFDTCIRLFRLLQHIVIVGTDVLLEPYGQDDENELQQTLEMFQTLPKLSLSTNWAKEDIEASGDLT